MNIPTRPWGAPTPVGMSFGRLTVLAEADRKSPRRRRWVCKCACGSEITADAVRVRNGHTQSCGCLQKERTSRAKRVHGLCRSRTYNCWLSMRIRCTDSRARNFRRYGGRGIRVCERWTASFEAFLEDMGECPSNDHSLDRIDNDGHYEPGNVRWATRSQQARNTRTNRFVEFEGERVCLSDLDDRFGFRRGTVSQRLGRGDDLTRALRPLRGAR